MACTSVLQEFKRKWRSGIVRKETGSPSQNGEWQEPMWEGKGVKGLKNSGPLLTPFPGIFKVRLLLLQWLLKLSLFLSLTACALLASDLSDCSCAFSAATPIQSVLHVLIVLTFQNFHFYPLIVPTTTNVQKVFISYK